MLRIELSILRGMIYEDEYIRRVYPFLSDKYFTDTNERTVYTLAKEYIDKYNVPPTKEALEISLNNLDLYEDEHKECLEILTTVKDLNTDEKVHMDWLVEESEKFCQQQALYNAIREGMRVIDGKSENTPHALPQLLQDALGVSFDTDVGSDYFDNAESRYDEYLKVTEKLPFDISLLNTITRGGSEKGTLNCILAGCVHPDTKVKVRVNNSEIEISISEIEHLLECYDVEIEGVDGFVPVAEFVDKGMWDEYLVADSSGNEVRVNENHLFECDSGWILTKDMAPDDKILKSDGSYHDVTITKTGIQIPIVDIVIDHENHRYYANGFSSHNTNVGKSLALCHFAQDWLSKGKNVVYLSMEMAEHKLEERVDANMMDVSIADLPNIGKDHFLKKIGLIRKKTSGVLKTKQFPTSAAHVGHFRHFLNELKLKKKFVPDVIIIDYLNICASNRYKNLSTVNSYTLVKAIAEELRGLAVELGVPIWTATQTNRDGQDNSNVTLNNVSESHGLSQTVDFMIALTTSEELETRQQLQAIQLKNRYSTKSDWRKFVIGVDYTRMRLYDAEQMAQEGIVGAQPAEPYRPPGVPPPLGSKTKPLVEPLPDTASGPSVEGWMM